MTLNWNLSCVGDDTDLAEAPERNRDDDIRVTGATLSRRHDPTLATLPDCTRTQLITRMIVPHVRARNERDESRCFDGAPKWAFMPKIVWGMTMHCKRTKGYVRQWLIGKSVVRPTILYSPTVISIPLMYGGVYPYYQSIHVWRDDDLLDTVRLHQRRLWDPRTIIRDDCRNGRIRFINENTLRLRIEYETTARQLRSTMDHRFRYDSTTKDGFRY